MSDFKSTLQNLSSDCLELIVELLSAYDLGKLWLAGSLQLQTKLSDHGAAKRFEFSFELKYPFLWPTLMQYLPHLTTVSITSNQDNYFNPNFEMLPSKLRNVKFDSNEVAVSFLVFLNENPARFPYLESLTAISNQHVPDLHLDFSSLSNLTKLELQLRHPHSKLILPPHLTFLRTEILETAELSPFPPSLTSLSLVLPLYQNDWSYLPPDLESLEISYAHFKSVNVGTLDDDLIGLPTKLHSLAIVVNKFTPALASKLPPRLTKLRVRTKYRISEPVKMEIFAHLPKTLRFLSGTLLPLFSNFSEPTMQAKSLPQGLQIEIDGLIPGTLAFLPIGTVGINFDGLSMDDLHHLPRYTHLIKLTCPRLEPEMLAALPRTLKRLHLMGTISNLRASQARQLPPHLEYLQTQPFGADFDALQHLPQTLVLLVSKFDSRKHIEAALHLPSTLKFLHLYNTRITKALLMNLPHELPTLILSSPKQKKLGSVTLTDTLPRFKKLRRLEIYATQVNFSGARKLLQCLPRQLKLFTFEVHSSDLKEDHLGFLPQGVRFKTA